MPVLYNDNIKTSWCRRTGANKGNCEGEIKYLGWAGPMCKKHAQQLCDLDKTQLPDPKQWFLENVGPLEPATRNAFNLIKSSLKLQIHRHGGCPEENTPDDVTIMLVLGSQVISEVTL